jgi:hypothetical protein
MGDEPYSPDMFGGAEEHRDTKPGQLATWQNFEPSTSRTQFKSVTDWVNLLGLRVPLHDRSYVCLFLGCASTRTSKRPK